MSTPRTHRLLTVGHLIPDDQAVVGVSPDTSVRDALALMRSDDFDQLPVSVGQTVLGVFSYRSMARRLPLLPEGVELQKAPVDALLESYRFVSSEDDLESVLPSIDQDGAVLVGHQRRLLAVATAEDVTRLLWSQTHPFVLLRDIEMAIRSLMSMACPDSAETHTAITRALPAESTAASKQAIEHLALGHVLQVLQNAPNWGQWFRHTFGPSPEIVASTLDPVVSIRNRVFHFRGQATENDLVTLASARAWLKRRLTAAEATT